MNPLTAAKALEQGRERLAPIRESAQSDAQVLLAHIIDKDKAWVLAHPEYELNDKQEQKWQADLARMEKGEPLPYVLEEWEFFGLKLKVSPAVLIPRPETELLVEAGLHWLTEHPGRRRALDVGTGSGCIPVALAHNVLDLQVVATDISAEALDVARTNVERYHLSPRVQITQTNLADGVEGPFDLITANLPYIPDERLPSLAVSKWEPRVALGGGPDGLRFIEPFLGQAQEKLASQGLILAEIDASLESAAKDLAKSIWSEADVQVRKDLAGLPRLLVIETK